MKTIKLNAALMFVLSLILLAPSFADAAGRKRWVGRDSEGTIWVISDQGGGNWTGWDSKLKVSLPYTEVTRTDDFIEIELENSPSRLRIYEDKILCSSSPLRKRWTEFAEGKWK